MNTWRPRLYLKVGDRVRHTKCTYWGSGEVVEEKHSTLEGGCCLVKIKFDDGVERSFINNLDSELCCYLSGIRLQSR
jgi:hypothetical protein